MTADPGSIQAAARERAREGTRPMALREVRALACDVLALADELDAARDENKQLREALTKHRKQCPGVIEFMDGHVEDCPACAALASVSGAAEEGDTR